jgi:hypothetical protein
MSADVDAWLKSGEYLPKPLRDFHAQKDVFKAIHQTINVSGHEYAKSVDWVSGQCYVIDIFLWWMARRGYTLQRTRRRGHFRDLAADVAEQTRKREDHLLGLLRSASAPQAALTTTADNQ